MNTLPAALLFVFLLNRIEEPELEPGEDDPWPDLMVDACSAMVVVAENDEQARKIAATGKMDEGSRVWMNPRYTTCVVVGTSSVPAGVLVRGETPQTAEG